MKRAYTRFFLSTALLGAASAVVPTAACAQSDGLDRQILVAIPAQTLSGALQQLFAGSGLQLVYDTKITDGKTAPAISGTMTGREAVARLLAGSGLTFHLSGDRTVVIAADANGVTAVASDGVRSAGVVTVEGSGGNMPYGELASPVNGINGSRDVEATEGTGSYTTGATSIASKIPLTLRETPQSVSVVTRQQIKDQTLISVKDVLERLPGITSTPGPNGEEFNIYSRGFQINTYTFDGGAPVSYSYGNRPVLDTSEFDSVQLVRGADGMFGGYGDPGGVVNLVRKKPLDHRQITYDQDFGSFDLFREEMDVTGPLTANHSLRGRFVAARQDNHFFYDVAYARKTSVYGSLEYDLTPRTLLTVGGSLTWERNRPNQGGLPLYADGGEIDFPRSTCLCSTDNFDRGNKKEFYATLNQKFNDNLALKINGVYTNETVNASYYGVSSVVVRGGDNSAYLGGYGSYNPTRQTALDASLNGAFDLLGRHHQFVIGGNYVYANNDGGANYGYPTIAVPNIFDFNPDAYPIPASDYSSKNVRSRIEQYGGYASTRLEIMRWLHLNLGIRYNYSRQELTTSYSFFPDPQVSNPIGARNLSKPAVGVTLDVLRNFTLYASHTSIYKPQTYTQTLPGNAPPPPITGTNDEAGIKFQSPSKKFSASVAYYSVKQNGFLGQDPNNPNSTIPVLQDTKSRGVDVEATGEIFPNVQVSASYTYNNNSTKTAAYPSGTQSSPATSFAPRHKAKVWVVYRPSGDAFLQRIIIGGGVDTQSKAFNTGYVCGAPSSDPINPCPSFVFVPYNITTRPYTTLSAKLGYRMNDHVELSLVGKNLANVKTYASSPVRSLVGYNFYIPPFTLVGSIGVHF